MQWPPPVNTCLEAFPGLAVQWPPAGYWGMVGHQENAGSKENCLRRRWPETKIQIDCFVCLNQLRHLLRPRRQPQRHLGTPVKYITLDYTLGSEEDSR